MSALPISLEDKYTLASGRVYLNGTQALVRLAMMQRERDLAAGLNTAGFISGYRGSTLGGFDQALWKAKKRLKDHHIHFTPGVNEELAVTAVWASDQVGLFEGAKYDGVFAMWYGKGSGVDRAGDAMKHANAAGSSKHGGVLMLAGDDHACKSSTLPHQSEHAFDAAMIPVLYPTGVQEILELGLHGFAMSRYSGCYVAFKVVSETVDSSASITIDPDSPRILLPQDFPLPAGGVNIRWPDAPMEQEMRLQHDKIYAALAYARVNRLNRVTVDSPNPRLGIIASGKSYLDVLQALDDLGIDARHAGDDRARDRRAHRQVLYVAHRRGAAQVPRGERGGARPPARQGRAHSLFLLGLPAQHVDACSRRIEGAGGNRLPLHGDLDPARRDHDLHADGRGGRSVDRHRALHRNEARLRQPRRRHLFPLGPARDPRGGRGERQHHLQDPFQRRGGDDRRPARRRLAQRADDHAAGRGRRRQARRGRHRPAREIRGRIGNGARHDGASSRRPRHGAARAARSGRHQRPDLRPDVRRREAPPPQARHVPRPAETRRHQRARLRRLRGLQREVELPVGSSARDRVRPQARHRPELVQQGLFLPERLLPELRHRRGRG